MITVGAGDTARATSPSFTPASPGYWCFAGYYSGDDNYGMGSDATVDECVDVTPLPLQVTTTSLPAAQIGVAYSATLTAADGTAPYKWHLQFGRLPHGLTLDRLTGTISGTPGATAVTERFKVRVKDKGHPKQFATKILTITVS